MRRNVSIEGFHEKYEPITETGCWIWMGGVNNKKGNERGQFYINRRPFLAHRLSYTIHKGEIPDGLRVLHTCDVTLCVNPDHLYVGTQQDNMRDMARRGHAGRTDTRGEKHGASKLNETKVREILASGEKYQTLAERYGVTESAIGLVKRRRNWRHVEVFANV